MKRRDFLKAGGAGLASSAIAAPAVAQSMPELKWRLTSSFPKSLDTLYGASEIFAKAVAEATDNKFQIQCFAAGEIVPGLQALDAVSNGTVEMCATAPYYYAGKDPTFTFGTALPFGLNARMQLAWQRFGGGMELMNELYKKFNVYGIPAGYQSLIRSCSALAHEWELAKYDANNPEALKRLVSQGAQLKPFPPAVMEAALGAALELYREISAENPFFKKVWESTLAFRN